MNSLSFQLAQDIVNSGGAQLTGAVEPPAPVPPPPVQQIPKTGQHAPVPPPPQHLPPPVQHVPAPVQQAPVAPLLQHLPPPVQHLPPPVQHLPPPVQQVPATVQQVPVLPRPQTLLPPTQLALAVPTPIEAFETPDPPSPVHRSDSSARESTKYRNKSFPTSRHLRPVRIIHRWCCPDFPPTRTFEGARFGICTGYDALATGRLCITQNQLLLGAGVWTVRQHMCRNMI
jgi:hypothetical protein